MHLPEFESPERSRSLSCCLVGPTNAGKSTLLNRLIDSRVSAVSDRIHTTRENTLGYLTDVPTATQVEFIDAPGALGPDVPALHRAVWDAVRSADLALVVVDAADTRSHRQVSRFLRKLRRELDELEAEALEAEATEAEALEAEGHGSSPSGGGAYGGGGPLRPQTALVLNKVDLVTPKSRLLGVSRRLHDEFAFDWPPLMVSAESGDGIEDMRQWLLLHSRPGEWVMAEGVVHVQPPLERATEIIREQIFSFLTRELPYMVEQRNLGWTELPNGGLRIDQQLVMPKRHKSARRIVERRIPGIAKAARLALCDEFERPVSLSLSLATVTETIALADATAVEDMRWASRGPSGGVG